MINQDKLLENFIEESHMHLQDIEPDLLEIEKGSENFDGEIVNRVFRAIHSIKGAAGFFGFHRIGELTHVMESLLSLLRDKKIQPVPDMIDALLTGIDVLRAMVDDIFKSNEFNILKEVDALNKFLTNKNTKQKIVKVTEKLNSESTDRKPISFDLPLDQIERFAKTGSFLYCIRLLIEKDISDNGNSPYDFINNLSSLGECLDSFLDISIISNLRDCLDNDMSVVFLFASIIDPEIVSAGLKIPEEKITIIDIEEYRKKYLTDIKKTLDAKTSEPVNTPLEKEKEKAKSGLDNLEDFVEKPETQNIKAVKQIQLVHTEDKIRVGVNILNDLVNLAGELVLGRNQLMQVTLPIVKNTHGLNPALQLISRITTEMQGRIMQMRMQPVSNLFGKFHRIVRDLAKSLNKEINLITTGEDVELDKTIIESLSDPLTHLIRNSIDHGIESPEKREKASKQRQGTIELKAYHQAGQVYLEVNDDGAGIDPKKVATIALEKGLITREQLNNMTEKEKIRLILKAGFSTAKQVTEVSGRGVGMDVVITNIEKLGGKVEIETNVNKGTNIRLVLPLTLAIVSGLVIKAGGQSFIIPEVNIEELVRITEDEIGSRINTIQDALVLRLRDTLLPLIHLKKLMNISYDKYDDLLLARKTTLRLLVTKHGSFRQGIIVDNIENIEEIVVKPLPCYLKKMKFFSGASIMGNGTIALILDISGLIEKANLHYLEETIEKNKFQDQKIATKGETQTLLLFDNKTEERFALPLELITRVERVQASETENIKNQKYLQYQGEKLKLLFLEDYLPVNRPERNPEDIICVIIPKLTQYPLGIVVNKIIGTINAEVELDTETIMASGIFGSAVIGGKITLFPDLYKIFEQAAPEWYKTGKAAKSEKKDKYRILLVDDTAFFRMVESEYLISAGYEVIQAESGKKALSILSEETVDAVVLDIIMPDLTGWDVIKTIRQDDRLKRLPVMAVTSLGDNELVLKGKEVGFNDWEIKLNKSRLLEKLECMLR